LVNLDVDDPTYLTLEISEIDFYGKVHVKSSPGFSRPEELKSLLNLAQSTIYDIAIDYKRVDARDVPTLIEKEVIEVNDEGFVI